MPTALSAKRPFSHFGDRANIENPILVVRDGDEALFYLRGEGKYANRAEYPLPCLLLLDLKMPRVSGFDVLAWVRRQPSLASLRVVVLTASEQIRDVNRAYQMGADSFLVKPVDYEQLVQLITTVHGYWIGLNRSGDQQRPEKDRSDKDRRDR